MISKTQVPLGSPNRYREQMQILMHRLECISRDLKVLWIASKVFLMYLGGNRLWVPLNTGLTVVRSAAQVVTFMFKFHDQAWFNYCFLFQHVPSIVVLVYSILCIIGVLPIILLVMVLSGTVIGWVYLRFYQPRGKGVKGDLSEGFSCASFFPEAAQ